MEIRDPHNLHQQAWCAFQRDLAQLWVERPGQWVAYRGECQVGFASHKHELYQQCYRQGWPDDEFVIFCIEPIETEMVFDSVMLD